MAEKPVFLPSLFCLVVDKLVCKVLLNLLSSVFVMQISSFLRYILVEGVEAGLLQGIVMIIRVTMQLAMKVIEVDPVLP